MYMSDTLNLANSIWPNGMQVDSDGHAVFYPLGTNKVEVPTSLSEWPKGNKLVSPFVYQDDKLVGFADTKALTTDSQTTIYLPYEHIEAEFSAIDKGQLQIHAPNATTKKASWKDSGVEDIPEVQFKYKGCSTVDDVMQYNWDEDMIYDDENMFFTWSAPLWDLENGEGLFSTYSDMKEFSSDLPNLTNGSSMFEDCSNLTTFSSDLSSLTDGEYMFAGSGITSFSSDLSSLTDGGSMFSSCYNLESFSSDLSSLTNGTEMFYNCENLTTFSSDLSSLVNGYYMFQYCENLINFNSKLSSLEDGIQMFHGCKLDTASVQNIADTINTYNGYIDIGIGNSTPNEQEITAFNKMVSKGWTVYVNGSKYTPTSPAAITTLDENGEETVTPIPFWAKPVPSDEEHAQYVDEQGNFFNILGAQFIYGDDISTYGMFTCEEDAAANMRLTPYIKPIERN